jgi:hypothetical protein
MLGFPCGAALGQPPPALASPYEAHRRQVEAIITATR